MGEVCEVSPASHNKTIPSAARHPREETRARDGRASNAAANAMSPEPCFAAPFPGRAALRAPRRVRCARGVQMAGGDFLRSVRERLLRPLVSVPGSEGKGAMLECVFCKGGGVHGCDACKGGGRDALGVCLMCGGAGSLKCSVCSGVGVVDRIRRGGTDDKAQYLDKKKM